MSFANFYLIAGGTGSADINAGSSVGAAQAAATTGGNWNSGTGVFIAASGTPFAATVVGDYASVYVDGGTVTTFVGKVTTVTSSTQITVDVATTKYGTAPSTSANARSCVINGSWNTEQVLAAGGLAGTTVPQSTKVNIKGNLTIAASRTISMAGTTTAPLWFSGYNASPGDLDNDTTNTLAKPIWTLSSTFSLTTSGSDQMWSGISIVGTRSGVVWSATGVNLQASRMRCENNSSNAAAIAAVFNGTNGQTAQYCWFKCPTTATTTGTVQANNAFTAIGCVFDTGGLAGLNVNTSNAVAVTSCVCINNTGVGIRINVANAIFSIAGCTISNSSSDGILIAGAPTRGTITGCVFRVIGSNVGINNNTGTNMQRTTRACNLFYSCTTAESGFGDSPAFFQKTDTADPVTSASNMTPIPTSTARNNGFPGIFENETFNSYAYIGAVQPNAFGSGFFIQ